MSDRVALPWNEIRQILEKSRFKEIVEKISKSTFIFAAKKKNEAEVSQSALKLLQQTDPEHATPERAKELANIMEIFAKGLIKDKISRKK